MSGQICNKEQNNCQDCRKLKVENEKLGRKLQEIQRRIQNYENSSENEGNCNKKLKDFMTELRDIFEAGSSSSSATHFGFDVEMDFNSLIENVELPQIFEQTAEQKAFSNPLIVRKVLKHVPTPSVLNWRLINRLWREEATTQLLTSPAHLLKYQVAFSWSVEKGEFEHLTMGNLTDLNEFLNSQSQDRENSFPCHYFRFEGGDLGSRDAQLFFTKYGREMVTGLRLNLVGPDGGRGDRVTKIHTLRALILDQVPQLAHLWIENTPWSEVTPVLNTISVDRRIFLFSPYQYPRTLPHLEYLRFDPGTTTQIPANLVFDLLTAAVNLKNTLDPTLRFVYQLISANKIQTVDVIGWYCNPQELNRLMVFADTWPKLRTLGLNFDLIRGRPDQVPLATNFLSKVLASSADTLVKWNRMPPIDFLTGLKIPPMTKLHTITFDELLKRRNGGLFPPALNLESPPVFPSVTTVTVFNSIEKFNASVRAQQMAAAAGINLNLKPAASWMQMVASAVPQLQHLNFQILKMADIPDFLRTVWKVCPRLKTLICDIRYEPKHLDKNSCVQLDSAITGISVEICKKLRKLIHQNHISSCAKTSGRTAITTESVEIMRQNASILNLKELEQVRFFLRDFGAMNKKAPLFSRVSFVYGFDLLQKRQAFGVTFTHGFVQSDLVEELDTF